MDLKSYKGDFSSYNEESISLEVDGKLVTCMRDDVLRVSLRGPSKRTRHALTGLIIGGGAGLILGLVAANGEDEGFQIISDNTVTVSVMVLGAGAGALFGTVYPAHDYRIIYRGQPGDQR